MKRSILTLIILATALPLCAQNSIHRLATALKRGPGVTANIVPYAQVRVCQQNSTGSPCSPLASIYSDINLTQHIVQPFPGVVADINGNYGYYAAPGCYDEQVAAAGFPTLTTKNVCAGTSGSGGASFPSNPGVVYNTSTSVSQNATGLNLDTLLGTLTGCATMGWLYSPQAHQCIAPAGGIASINGDSTQAQTIAGTGGITCSTIAGATVCNYAGSAGTGAVGSSGPYNDTSYTPGTAGTTVGGSAKSFTLPLNLSTSQITTALGTAGRWHIQYGDAHTPFPNTSHYPITDDRNDIPALIWNVKASGAQCDAGAVQGTFTAGSQTITRSGSASDIGKIIMTVGSVGGVPTSFISTITSLDGSNNDVLTSKSPFTTAANWVFALGHDDSVPLASALTYGYASSTVTLALPGGTCLSSQTLNFDGQNIWGHGINQSEIVGPPGLDTFAANDPSQNPSGRTFSPGQHIKDFTIAVDGEIDATQAWTSCVDAVSGSTPVCTSQTPLYRPIGIGSVNANDPLNRGWITGTGVYSTGAINGVANTTSSSAIICVPNSTGQQIPSVGQQIIFPYQGLGNAPFSTTVSSFAGSCGTGFSPVTLANSWPGSTLTGPQYVAAQEWFAGTSIQTVSTAIPGSAARNATITAYSITSNVITITASNGFSSGQVITLSGFGTSTFLNGAQVTLTSASGSQFVGPLTHANASATEAGAASIFPLQVTLANDITPDPEFSQANFASYGVVEIDGEIFSYFGTSNVPASQSLTGNWIKLTSGAQNGSSAVSHSSGAIIFPLNPLNPALAWPVIPTLNTNTTPTGAEPYPSNGVGNVGIGLPTANGVGASGTEAPAQALWENFQIVSWPPAVANSAQSRVSFQESNDTGCIYEVAIPFKSTMQHWQCLYTYYGIAQGMPSINTYDQGAGGFPTADGNKVDDYQIHAAYDEWWINEGSSAHTNGQDFSDAAMPPNNTWPGYPVAPNTNNTGSGGLGHMYFDGYYNDASNTSGNVPCCNSRTGLGQVHIDTQYVEVEAPGATQTAAVFQLWGKIPVRQLNCNNCIYTNWEPKDGGDPSPTYFGGGHQLMDGGVGTGTPWINFGFHNIYQNVAGLGAGAYSYVYGSGSFLNWGPGTQMTSSSASSSPFLPNLIGNSRQNCSGQTQEAFFFGNVSNPYTCAISGFIGSEEFNTSAAFDASPMSQAWVLDPTEAFGSYVGCNVTTSGGCSTYQFGPGNPITIGPGQRLVAGPYLVYADFKTPTSGTNMTFNLAIAARATVSCTTTTVYSASTPITNGWTQAGPILVDFTGKSGCDLNVAYTNSSINLALQTGYLNFVPLAQNIEAKQFTLSGGAYFAGGTTDPPSGSGQCTNNAMYINSNGAPGHRWWQCQVTTWVDIN